MRPFVSAKNLNRIENLEDTLTVANQAYDKIVPRLVDYYFETKGYKFSHIGKPEIKEIYLEPKWEPFDEKYYGLHKVISLFDDSTLHTLVFSKKEWTVHLAENRRIYKKAPIKPKR